MTVEQMLDRYLAGKGMSRSDAWIYFTVGSVRLPVYPSAPFRRFLIIHDLHHLITGYSTSLFDEVYLIGWELTSGGWGRHNWWYFGKPVNLIWMFVLNPTGVWKALKAGSRCRNLHRFDVDEVLAMDYDDAVAYVYGRRARAI